MSDQPLGFFWYDPVDYELHQCPSMQDAIRGAQHYLDQALTNDGWGIDEDTIAGIVIGTITHYAKLTVTNPTEEERIREELPPGEIWNVTIEANT